MGATVSQRGEWLSQVLIDCSGASRKLAEYRARVAKEARDSIDRLRRFREARRAASGDASAWSGVQ